MRNKSIINTLRLFVAFSVMCLFIQSCKPEVKESVENLGPNLTTDTSVKFAKRFSISIGEGFKVLHLFGNRNDNDTTANFIIYNDQKPNVKFANSHFIKTPCSKIISLSSIYSNMIAELNCTENMIAIESKDYYNNPAILKNVESGKIKEVQRNPEIDKELVLNLKPDVIFAFGMGRSSGDFDSKIVEAGIPVVIILDHLEKLPLARAEWIKFFAVFLNKEKEANKIFDRVTRDYDSLKILASSFKNKPTVFSELKYGDTWFEPGGKSFMAQLIRDANATYLWEDDTAFGSLPLSFEAVYKKANKADYWLNVSMTTNKQQILEQDKRYADFAAFKNNKIYNNNLHCNKLSYSSYWETGMIYPNRILSDFIQIFHKEANDSLTTKFYYYRNIQ